MTSLWRHPHDVRFTAVPAIMISDRSAPQCDRRFLITEDRASRTRWKGLLPDTGEAVEPSGRSEDPFRDRLHRRVIDRCRRLFYCGLVGGLHADRLSTVPGQQEENRTISIRWEENNTVVPRPTRGDRGHWETQNTQPAIRSVTKILHLLSKAGASAAGSVLCDPTEVQCRYRENVFGLHKLIENPNARIFTTCRHEEWF